MKLKRKIRILLETWFDRVYYSYNVVRRRRKGSEYELRQWASSKKVDDLPEDVNEYVEQLYKGLKFDKRWIGYYGSYYKMMQTEQKYDLKKAVPSDLFYQYIDPCFCNPISGLEFSDKNFTDLLFADVQRPKCVVRCEDGLFLDSNYNLISAEEAYRLCVKFEELVIKPSARSGGGKGIAFLNPQKGGLDAFCEYFSNHNSYLVQELIKQHPVLSQLHPDSLNTIRLVTLLWKGDVLLISSFIRMGVGGSKVDNAHAGGLFCGIESDGSLQDKAVDYNFNVYTKHPNGAVFKDFVIPNYDKCVAMVKKIAPRMVRIAKMISWDVAINEAGDPVLLESNMMYNGVDAPQIVTGPIFGDKTEEIIEYVKQHQRYNYDIL